MKKRTNNTAPPVPLERLVRSLRSQAAHARKTAKKYDREISSKAHFYASGQAIAFQWASDALKKILDASNTEMTGSRGRKTNQTHNTYE